MSDLDFSVILPAPRERLMELATDFENFPKYIPHQLKSVVVLEKNEKETTTLETIEFSSYLKTSFEQKTIHRWVSEHEIESDIVSGPAKGTKISMIFEKLDNDTKVSVFIQLKLNLKTKFLLPIIKKWYKRIILSILYKMNALIMNE